MKLVVVPVTDDYHIKTNHVFVSPMQNMAELASTTHAKNNYINVNDFVLCYLVHDQLLQGQIGLNPVQMSFLNVGSGDVIDVTKFTESGSSIYASTIVFSGDSPWPAVYNQFQLHFFTVGQVIYTTGIKDFMTVIKVECNGVNCKRGMLLNKNNTIVYFQKK